MYIHHEVFFVKVELDGVVFKFVDFRFNILHNH
jgi:hypothetical protein